MTIEMTPSSTPDPEWDKIVSGYLSQPGSAPEATPMVKQAAPVDPMGDTPLTPAWSKTRAGWKARAKVGRVNSTRGFRKWLRRQATEHGHAAQTRRGIARTALWVQGTEGTQVTASRHEVQQAQRDYKTAKWAHDRRVVAGKEKDKRRKDMEGAFADSVSAMTKYKAAQKDARTKRTLRAAAALAPVAGIEGAGIHLLGAPGGLLATGATLAALALIGRRTTAGELYNDRDAKIGDGDRMTDEMVDRAFRDAGIIRAEQAVVFRSPVIQDGRAWLVHVEVTGGVTVAEVQKKSGSLASALGIPRHQMDIRHEGREDQFSLWVSMTDPFGRTVPNPLLDQTGKVNAWKKGLPLGFDKRGSVILATISDYSLLVGGTTRSGKGMAIANILVGAMLDPRIRVRLFDGKGTGEYVGIAEALDTFVRRNPERLLQFLKVLAAELERRTDILVDLGVSKASEELLDQLGGIELVIVDELATYTVKGGLNGQHAEEITELLAQIAAVGAAVGIVLVLATQSPKVDVVPSRLRGNCAGRWAMRVESATASNTILGDGVAGDGYDSAKIENSKGTRGRGWLTTPDTGFIEARSLFVDVENGDLRRAARAGLELRRAIGRAPGQCPDPIEDQLAAETGVSMVAGGPTGKGTLVQAAPKLPEAVTLARAAFATAGDPERMTSTELHKLVAGLAADWEPGVDESAEQARDRFLKALREAAAEIAPDVDMKAKQWMGGRGYYLVTITELTGETAPSAP